MRSNYIQYLVKGINIYQLIVGAIALIAIPKYIIEFLGKEEDL
jgi:hypothetical protein